MERSRVQAFGHLIVLDQNLTIVGMSELVIQQLKHSTFLNQPVDELLSYLLPKTKIRNKKLLQLFANSSLQQTVVSKTLFNQEHHLKIHKVQKHIFIEFEKKISDPFTTVGEDFDFVFENNNYSNWNFICKALNKILNYDRIFVIQISKTGRSSVIAEHVPFPINSLKEKEFSKDFLPLESLKYYQNALYRYVPDIHSAPQTFFQTVDEMDIGASFLKCPPNFHINYFQSIGVKSAIFFPLFIQDKLWGLIIGHNLEVKPIDLQHRKVCRFIVQNAIYNFEAQANKGLIEINNQLKNFQQNLIQKIYSRKNVVTALKDNLNFIKSMINADHVVLFGHRTIFKDDIILKNSTIQEIIHLVKNESNSDIFHDHNFKKKFQSHFTIELPFAGLLLLDVNKDQSLYILWFRKEKISSKIKLNVTEKKVYGFSSSEELVQGSSIPWSDHEITVVENFQHVIQQNGILEKSLKNDSLKIRNSLKKEMEIFTKTLYHETKNPLAIIKMSLEYLDGTLNKQTINNQSKIIQNLYNSIFELENIIDNSIQYANQDRNLSMINEKGHINLLTKIEKNLRKIYPKELFEINFNNIYPVMADYGILYQIYSNIMENAIKYKKPDQPLKLTISSVIAKKFIGIYFQDNGIGMPKQFIDLAFNQFSRAENVKNLEGSGIGLFIVKKLVDKLYGKIKIESKLGQGSCIKIYLLKPIS